jgi:hypothetical protein
MGSKLQRAEFDRRFGAIPDFVEALLQLSISAKRLRVSRAFESRSDGAKQESAGVVQ